MTAGIIEIVSAFLVFVGLCAVVAAAAMVSVALAVLAAGVFIVLLGIVGLYVAVNLERETPKKAAS